jgi:hypothetical protein
MEFGDESVGVAFGRSKFSVSAKKYICSLFLCLVIRSLKAPSDTWESKSMMP